MRPKQFDIHMQTNKRSPFFTICVKINLKWIIDVNIRANIKKDPRGNHRIKWLYPWVRQEFLRQDIKSNALTSFIGFLKIKNLAFQKALLRI